MEALAELIKVANRKRISKVDVLDKTFLNTENNSLYYQLYNAIEKKLVKTDDEAGKLLYGTGKHDHRYRMLKSRLKDKLKNTILLFNSDEVFQNNNQTKAYYNSLKNLHTLEILIKLNGTNLLTCELIKDDFRDAEIYKFYDILKSYSYHMLNYYSLTGNVKQYYEEEKKYLKYTEFADKDQRSKYLFFKIFMKFNSKNNVTPQYLADIEKEIMDYKDLVFFLQQHESMYLYNYLRLMLYENSGDVKQIIQVCNEMDELLTANAEISNNMRRYLILYYRVKAKLHLKNFSEGLRLLEHNKNIVPIDSSNNWFILKEIEFKLYLHSKMLPQAHEIYNTVTENKSLKTKFSDLIEKWKIYHAYLVFMDNYLNKGDYKFNLAKFLNDVPVSSKDKSGYNFAVRVIEILFHAARKDYNLIFSKMDALRVYRSRYLNDNTYKRNHLFLSILLRAEKSGFNAREMQKADWPEIEELQKQNNYIIADWEIIPYEELWDIFCDLAKK